MLDALRTATRPLHDKLDGAALSARVVDGTATPEDYRALIGWQRAVHGVVEAGLADFSWPGVYRYVERYEVLAREATALGLGSLRLKSLAAPDTLAAAVGRAYVLEGSALGGNMILGRLRANAVLEGLSDFDFYAFQRNEGLRQWRAFLAMVQAREWSEGQVATATHEARVVFGIFGRAVPGQIA